MSVYKIDCHTYLYSQYGDAYDSEVVTFSYTDKDVANKEYDKLKLDYDEVEMYKKLKSYRNGSYSI